MTQNTSTQSATGKMTLTGYDALVAQGALDRDAAVRARRQEIRDALDLGRSYSLGETIDLGNGDAVAEITSAGGTYWAAVAGNKRPPSWVETRDEALVHLVALRHDGRSTQAHTYAMRTMNAPYTK